MPFNFPSPSEVKDSIQDVAKDLAEDSYAVLAWKSGPEKARAMVEKIKFMVDSENGKDSITALSGNLKGAPLVSQVVKETRDRGLLTSYLDSLSPDRRGNELPLQLQKDLLAAANEAQNVDANRSPLEIDANRRMFWSVNDTLLDAQSINYKRYQEGYAQGIYKNRVPEFVAGFPREQMQEIYKNNPDAFARTFPDSDLVTGEALQHAVSREIFSMKGTALTLDDRCSSVSDTGILWNSNLTNSQLHQIAKALCDTVDYNPNKPESVENVSLIVNRIIQHQNVGPQTIALLHGKFSETLTKDVATLLVYKTGRKG